VPIDLLYSYNQSFEKIFLYRIRTRSDPKTIKNNNTMNDKIEENDEVFEDTDGIPDYKA